MKGEQYLYNFQKGVDALIERREGIRNAKDYAALSKAETEAQTAMWNLHLFYTRLSFWLSEASDEARRRLAEPKEEAAKEEAPKDSAEEEPKEERRGFFGRLKKTKKEE